MFQAKGPIRAPFCLWAAVCLCAEQASGPFSVCVYNSPSVHTHSATFGPMSVSHFFFLFFFFLPAYHLYLFFCSTNTVVLFLSLVFWLKALCKATRKGLLAMPVSASMLPSIHFRSFPFFSVTCSHNFSCFRRTETHTTWLRGVKNKNTILISFYFHYICFNAGPIPHFVYSFLINMIDL